MSFIDTASIRKSLPGEKSKTALFRISIFAALLVWIADWSVKALPHASWWVPHYVDRSWAALPLSWALLLFMVALIGRPWMAWAAGTAGGGLAANMVDLKLDGVVWNMIPIPFSNGLVCNVADFAIVGGFLALAVGSAIHAGISLDSIREN